MPVVRVIYLTPADRKRHTKRASENWGGPVHPLSYEGLPIISEGLLNRIGMPIPDVSTIYEIERVG